MNLPADAGRVLLPLARASIARRLGWQVADVTWEEWLDEPGASFVTLSIGGRLRGCIGSLEVYRGLGEDVVANARAAAFRDPRFPALGAHELSAVRIEVSVLSAPEPMAVTSRSEALAALVPGRDGVILTSGGHRATFLPQVWEQLPQPEDFLGALTRKAGLPAGHWDEHTWLARYRVHSWIEPPA